jgi:hypothetical protein
MSQNDEIIRICNQEYSKIIDYDNIVGLANGTKVVGGKNTSEKCIAVFVKEKLPIGVLDPSKKIPKTINGIPTDVVQVGEIKAIGLTQRIRPAIGGYSVGVIGITAGTIGCAAFNGYGLETQHYILSNNHVLADENRAPLGSPILQPGPYDGGVIPEDIIGNLVDYEPIRFISMLRAPINFVDCAIALCPNENISPEIMWQGYINGITNPAIDLAVKKTGRTTGVTLGNIKYTNATVIVSYDTGNALFVNQIITNNMATGGDSGSLLLDKENNAVGLLFAGSSEVTVYNPINRVLATLKINLA